jgi:putative PIN family toxin of toxin-antitoxin system
MLPLRLVIDTNVLVSAALKPQGLERKTLLIALTKPAHLYVSRPIQLEYSGVLARPQLQIRKGLRLQLLQYIRNQSHLIVPAISIQACVDVKDDKFLECADAARTDYLITGNLKHFPASWKKTRMITSREFLSLAAPHLLS